MNSLIHFFLQSFFHDIFILEKLDVFFILMLKSLMNADFLNISFFSLGVYEAPIFKSSESETFKVFLPMDLY